jgi:hypothetical protein
VPVEFLSDAEAAAFGRFDGAVSRDELDRVFFLDDADRELIGGRRGARNRLGFALQLGTVRWRGAFLPDPSEVPDVVLEYGAAQLGVEDRSCVGRYLERRPTRFEQRRRSGSRLACGTSPRPAASSSSGSGRGRG